MSDFEFSEGFDQCLDREDVETAAAEQVIDLLKNDGWTNTDLALRRPWGEDGQYLGPKDEQG